jgi:predicted O-methyltransferase YrrM
VLSRSGGPEELEGFGLKATRGLLPFWPYGAGMPPKSSWLPEELHAYVVAHSRPPDPLLEELAEETQRRLGEVARMQIAPEQGAFLEWLTLLLGATNVVEVGTFTGYSSICLARGLAPGGRLLCCDVSEEWTSVARAYWERAGLSDRIELRLGPAADTLAALPTDPPVDLAFVDADKESYPTYIELLAGLVRPGGVIAVDNTLWGGAVTDAGTDDPTTRVIQEFNDGLVTDSRFDTALLPLADGVTLLRRRPD